MIEKILEKLKKSYAYIIELLKIPIEVARSYTTTDV